MMGRYLELKTRQTEEEAEKEKARAKDEVAHFLSRIAMLYWPPWKNSRVRRKADAYDVFRDAQSRKSFITATSHIIRSVAVGKGDGIKHSDEIHASLNTSRIGKDDGIKYVQVCNHRKDYDRA